MGLLRSSTCTRRKAKGPAWRFLEELADTRLVVAPLFPGFGDSQGLQHIDDIEDAAFHLLDVLDRLGLPWCDMVGLSLGGWMAAELAVRWPERVRRMVLVNPVGLYVDGAPITEIFGRAPSELADELFADPDFPIAQLMRAMDAHGGRPFADSLRARATDAAGSGGDGQGGVESRTCTTPSCRVVCTGSRRRH